MQGLCIMIVLLLCASAAPYSQVAEKGALQPRIRIAYMTRHASAAGRSGHKGCSVCPHLFYHRLQTV